MTWHPTRYSLHMKAASPAWYASSTLLMWRPLPADGHLAAEQGGCYLCHRLSGSSCSCEAIDLNMAVPTAPSLASTC